MVLFIEPKGSEAAVRSCLPVYMNPKTLAKLEKAPYPTGMLGSLGEHLRVLTRDEASYIPPVRISGTMWQLCPIVVPTRRNVLKNRKNILRVMRLVASRDRTLLIFLCSGTATKEDISLLAEEFPDLQWAAIDGPFPYDYHQQNFETTYSPLSYGGEKDIAQKRNVALQLARHMGWEMVVFLDDDIAITNDHLDKATDLLVNGNAAVVGFNARLYPDQSVAMHAHRWLYNSIDNFIGTGIMAVKTTTPFLSFFPHIYNEDWLFALLYRLLDEGNLVWAGSVRQAKYNPFKNAQRALSEEAGDLLGESLFKLALTLCDSGRRFKNLDHALEVLVEYANEEFWNMEINNRLDFLHGLLRDLRYKRMQPVRRYQAKKALLVAVERIVGKEGKGGITGEDLAEWMKAWQRDVRRWNTVNMPKKAAQSMAEALKLLELPNSLADHIDPSLFKRMHVTSDPIPKNLIMRPTHQHIGFTIQPRDVETMRKLGLTKKVQDYLAEKHLSPQEIITSANAIRFDRPTHSLFEIKPLFTISMVVGYGESVVQIRRSLKDIVRWTTNAGPLQVIVWVYNGSSKASRHQLENYRNIVIAQLVHDVVGTDVQLRSSVVTGKNENISQAIDMMLADTSLAYWKCNIAPDHPIYVTNSLNELLRLGTLCEFMHHEHVLPRYSLKHHLKHLQAKGVDSQSISPEEDGAAIYTSRERFKTSTRKQWFHRPRSSTRSAFRAMRRAKLEWVQLDDLTFNIRLHKTDTLLGLRYTECIPVYYKKDLPSNKQAVAREVIRTLKHPPSPEVSYMIVVCGQPDDSWEQLEQYRDDLMEIVMQHAPSNAIFSSLTYRMLQNEPLLLFKKRVIAIAAYIHWLQNDQTIVRLQWRPHLIRQRFNL